MHGNTLKKYQATFDTSVTFDTFDMKVSYWMEWKMFKRIFQILRNDSVVRLD